MTVPKIPCNYFFYRELIHFLTWQLREFIYLGKSDLYWMEFGKQMAHDQD